MSGVDDNGVLDDRYCCRKCEAALANHLSRLVHMVARRFIVCTTCGDKKCPRAQDHDLPCSKPVEPGKPGTPYR